jgi:hypothetical protein
MSILNMPTLVLNKGWQGIDATTVVGAFGKLFADRANAICHKTYTPYAIGSWLKLDVEQGDLYVKTTTSRVRAPEIIVSLEYNQFPKRTVAYNRKNLWRRDQFKCQYCGKEPTYDELTVDHIIPRARGGMSCFANCVLCCVVCNVKKANRTPEEAEMYLLKQGTGGIWRPTPGHRPKAPTWSPKYATGKKVIPKSWSAFLKDKRDELYWNVELED